MFFIIEKSEEITFYFKQNAATLVWSWLRIKMETQNIVNVLRDADKNLQNLRQENGMLSMIKITQTMEKEIKVVKPFNLKPKLLNQVFVITQTHILL